MLTPAKIDFLRKLSRLTDIEYAAEKTIRESSREASEGASLSRLLASDDTIMGKGRIELPINSKVAEYFRAALAGLGFDATTREVFDYLAQRRMFLPQPISDRSPEQTFAIVEQLFERLPFFDPFVHSHKIPIIWLNCELLDAMKSGTLEKVFANIMARAGVMAMAEANEAGVKPVAEECGYDFFAAKSNRRGQGCVIAWQPDTWGLVTSFEHQETTGVSGVPELRESAEVVLRHKPSGFVLRFLASHFKSLRGGWELTADVRFEQSTNLLAKINQYPVLPTIALGDYNCFLNRLRVHGNKDVDPFLTENWSLLGGLHDTRPTQLLGGRLDGIFFKWLSAGMYLDDYTIIPVYSAAPEVTDHAALIGTLHFQ
jgi:hypothetical protein